MISFSPRALPLLIGSLPHARHQDAVDLIFTYTPEIPLWPQLPANREEGMLMQFLPGLPGVVQKDDKVYIDTEKPDFDDEFLAFFEEYIQVTEDGELENSRFAMTSREAGGFQVFLEQARKSVDTLTALKGQVTGPITFCTGLVDQAGRAIFYNEQLRDAAVKLLALKAQWQTRKMAEICGCPLVFFDEPALAGFGSSAFITVTPADISACLDEVFSSVKAEGGLTGVHVCANTEWSVIFDSGVDIISLDSYSYFEKLLLYPEHLVAFFERGGILASGLVPTSSELIDAVDADILVERFFEHLKLLKNIGLAEMTVLNQLLITPSCGTGTVSLEQAQKVLQLTRDVSGRIRSECF